MEGDELLRLILQLAVCPLFPMVQAVRQPDNSRWLSHAFTFISNPGKRLQKENQEYSTLRFLVC